MEHFLLNLVLDLQPGAKGFQLSNPPVLECKCLLASLQVFEQTGMSQLTCKSRLLTGYLELLLEAGLANRRSSGEITGESGGERREAASCLYQCGFSLSMVSLALLKALTLRLSHLVILHAEEASFLSTSVTGISPASTTT